VKVVGVLAICSVVGWQEQVRPPRDSGALDATICDLAREPLRFANRIVRVRGRVYSAFEVFALVDGHCSTDNTEGANVWLDTFALIDPTADFVRYSRGWPLLQCVIASHKGELEDGARRSATWEDLVAVAPVPKSQMERFERRLRNHHGSQFANAILVGRFEYSEGGLLMMDRDGRLSCVGGFGHLGAYSRRIVLASIDTVPAK
jgi:hypothetical protein